MLILFYYFKIFIFFFYSVIQVLSVRIKVDICPKRILSFKILFLNKGFIASY